MFLVKHGENGKDAERAVGENFMKTAVKKTEAETYVWSKRITTKVRILMKNEQSKQTWDWY